jgi:hypothetical protein
VFDENTYPTKDWISSLPLPFATDVAPSQVSHSARVSATMHRNPVTIATNTSTSPAISLSHSTHSESPTISFVPNPTSPSESPFDCFS